MKTDVKDVSFCPRGNHCVPRSEMTTMQSDDGKSAVRTCVACKNETMDMRAKRGKNGGAK